MSDYQKPCGYPVMDCALSASVTKCEDRIEELEVKLAKVESERDAFASNIPDAAQNLIRNAHIGRLKALHRAVQNRKRIDELENIVEELADKLAQAVWRLEQMRDDQTAYRHVSHFRRGAAVTLSALEENK